MSVAQAPTLEPFPLPTGPSSALTGDTARSAGSFSAAASSRVTSVSLSGSSERPRDPAGAGGRRHLPLLRLLLARRGRGERARDYLHKTGRFIVIGGIVSPVHDSYGKQGLVSSRHRLIMCQLAVQNSDWIRVDPWECYQDTWQTTCSVLEHHRDLMKRVTGCILSNVNTPSMTPVIGQPQHETPQPIYQNSNVPTKPTAAKILGKVGESLSRICCVRPPVERFTFVDENANLGTVMRYEEIELRILLLCGSDLLESFCIPGLWNEADMEVIVGDFGIVVVPRDAADTDRIMNHSSILRKYKNNIMVVKDDINHPMSVVSSTKSRLALQHGDGHVVDYLSQPVIDYILKSQLYINASG
ncbi:nicotinamide/nicotinic acid mononucleotide adenylyltransferase 2 isoform X2 [Dasypus novemcinctus]|uniref:nicotinamide/nicotinic acid mononucleotide adenylyltransferase 2 isoform X2 n=1 Tax=Dasypus novemcinctus TaxID=9361 RepID=UPI00265E3CFD|nr:nicotinamide/nicotinic acid mononucleotide adenylyltransferase 2 isoform X2 [Dasypus novemcinctus]